MSGESIVQYSINEDLIIQPLIDTVLVYYSLSNCQSSVILSRLKIATDGRVYNMCIIRLIFANLYMRMSNLMPTTKLVELQKLHWWLNGSTGFLNYNPV